MPLATLLPRAGNAVSRCVGQVAAEHGLTRTALGVLDALGTGERLSHRELAAHLGVTPATLTPVVDALVRSGQVLRDRDAGDRRVVRLTLTTDGRARLGDVSGLVATALRERLPQPPAEHAEIVRAYLLAVLAAAGDTAEAGP